MKDIRGIKMTKIIVEYEKIEQMIKNKVNFDLFYNTTIKKKIESYFDNALELIHKKKSDEIKEKISKYVLDTENWIDRYVSRKIEYEKRIISEFINNKCFDYFDEKRIIKLIKQVISSKVDKKTKRIISSEIPVLTYEYREALKNAWYDLENKDKNGIHKK